MFIRVMHPAPEQSTTRISDVHSCDAYVSPEQSTTRISDVHSCDAYVSPEQSTTRISDVHSRNASSPGAVNHSHQRLFIRVMHPAPEQSTTRITAKNVSDSLTEIQVKKGQALDCTSDTRLTPPPPKIPRGFRPRPGATCGHRPFSQYL